MEKHELEKALNFEVYEILDGKYHFICACETEKMAAGLAKALAYLDKVNDPYYITSINYPHDLVIGGGWYRCFQKNENGKIEESELS